MSYRRVIPRDLFNEANLLKCLGRLCIALELVGGQPAAFEIDYVDGFEIEQDQSDGSISVVNLPFSIRGARCRLFRPLNSRQSWPLYAERGDVIVPVFDNEGALSAEFAALLKEELS